MIRRNIVICVVLLIFIILAYITSQADTNWKAKADFYSSNYPEYTNNQKAKMLASEMEDAGEKFEVIKEYYKIELLYIYQHGIRIWPPYDSMLEKYKELDYLGKKMIEYKGGKDEPIREEGR